jgi:O-antigen/teichoic acid export membrane protein
MKSTGFLDDLKNLVGKSVIYGIGSILLKAIGFFLIPLYTRHLSTADFGIMALTSSVSAFMVVIFALELRGAISYFYYNAKGDEERLENNGTIWIAMVSISLVMAVLFDFLGRPIFNLLFHSVPFDPYFRMSIWITFFTVLGQFPQNIFQVRERPIPYVVILFIGTLLNIGLVIYFVVFRNMGVFGYLMGLLIAGGAMAIPNIFVALKNLRLSIRWSVLTQALFYSLPLVPHSLSAWLLELSDRFILEKFVSLSDIGVYSLGYQLGSIVNLFASAVNAAWVPFVFRIVNEDPKNAIGRVSRLATYYILALSMVFLVVALFVREVIIFATPISFHSAYLVAYWVVVAQLAQGLYYVPVNFLFLHKKTQYIPIVTLSSAIVDVLLNLMLLPRYGMIAAAWAGLASKITMVLVVVFISNRVYPVTYEYARLGKLLGAAIALFGFSLFIPSIPITLSLVIKFILFLLFLPSLVFLRFFSDDEKQAVHLFLGRTVF